MERRWGGRWGEGKERKRGEEGKETPNQGVEGSLIFVRFFGKSIVNYGVMQIRERRGSGPSIFRHKDGDVEDLGFGLRVKGLGLRVRVKG